LLSVVLCPDSHSTHGLLEHDTARNHECTPFAALVYTDGGKLIAGSADHRMGFRQAHDAGRASAQAPKSVGEDAARARPRTDEVGEPGEEARARYQEEREERADGCCEGAGQRPGADKKIHSEVLPDADTASSDIITNTGGYWTRCADLEVAADGWQTVRSNEQMMQSMKGATQLLGSMNRQMNLPALQRIAMEFEKENDIMDQRQEMMDDAIDDVTGLEDEEEGEEVVNKVLDEIGVDLGQAVSLDVDVDIRSTKLTLLKLGETPQGLQTNAVADGKVAQAIGGDPGDDSLQARLDSLRR